MFACMPMGQGRVGLLFIMASIWKYLIETSARETWGLQPGELEAWSARGQQPGDLEAWGLWIGGLLIVEC